MPRRPPFGKHRSGCRIHASLQKVAAVATAHVTAGASQAKFPHHILIFDPVSSHPSQRQLTIRCNGTREYEPRWMASHPPAKRSAIADSERHQHAARSSFSASVAAGRRCNCGHAGPGCPQSSRNDNRRQPCHGQHRCVPRLSSAGKHERGHHCADDDGEHSHSAEYNNGCAAPRASGINTALMNVPAPIAYHSR